MKNIFTLLIVIIVVFSGCRKDEHIMDVVPGPGNPEITEESNLTGIVLDAEGLPVANAEINLGNTFAKTDANGVYFFQNAEISSTGSLIKINKQGFIPQFRFAFNEPGKLSYLNIELVPELIIKEFSSTTGGTFMVQNKSKVRFSPNSILNKDSSTYNGQVVLKGYWFDPFDDKTIANMPGDLRGINIAGEQIQLATQGMFSLDIYDPQGNELLVGDVVELSFYVGAKGVDVDGSGTMPLWYLDEDTGEWIEEASSTLIGDYFVGEVSHFSFWNCDYPYPLTCISATITDANGVPIPNTEIKIVEQNSLTCGTGTTNELGYFEAKVPAGVELVIFVKCVIDGVEIGSFNDDTNDIGDIKMDLLSIYFNITLLDCDQIPVPSGYILISVGELIKVFQANPQGVVSGDIPNCNNSNGEWKLLAYDPITLIYSVELTITPSDDNLDLDEIELCNEADLFITFEYKTKSSSILDPTDDILQVLILDNNYLIITNTVEIPTSDNFTLMYPLDQSLQESIFYRSDPNGNGTSSLTTSLQYNVNIDFTEYGAEVGDLIEGTWEKGDYKLNFRLLVNQTEESAALVVRSWDDINKNGIQDPTEDRIWNNSLYLRRADSNSSTLVDYPTFIRSFSQALINPIHLAGYRQYVGLIPNKEYVLRHHTLNPIDDPLVTLPNEGSDDNIDSDFIQVDVDIYSTDTFNLAPGQIERSIDIGLYEQ